MRPLKGLSQIHIGLRDGVCATIWVYVWLDVCVSVGRLSFETNIF